MPSEQPLVTKETHCVESVCLPSNQTLRWDHPARLNFRLEARRQSQVRSDPSVFITECILVSGLNQNERFFTHYANIQHFPLMHSEFTNETHYIAAVASPGLGDAYTW